MGDDALGFGHRARDFGRVRSGPRPGRAPADHVRERAVASGLTAAQATALREMTGPMTMRELSERMSREPSDATFVVDKLEKQGLVERRPHPADRRAKHQRRHRHRHRHRQAARVPRSRNRRPTRGFPAIHERLMG